MDVIIHGHRADVSERTRRRAEAAVRRIAARLTRAVDAVVRFEHDGPTRRVEVVLHAPRQRDIVAQAEGRFYGRVLSVALDRLDAQVRKLDGMRKKGYRKPLPEESTVA